ncbi:hypothetical protein ACFQV8_40625 [Pseudonocardia benzenivorans]
MIKLVRRELDKAVADAGRPPGSVKLVAVSWFYQLRNGETWEDGVDHGFASGPISSCLTNIGFMRAHAAELDPSIVEASAAAATAYLGDPNATEQPHYLDTWSKYQKGLDQSHRPLITKQLCDYWCLYGSPDEIWEKAQGMIEAGVDMLSVFLSNPFTAERTSRTSERRSSPAHSPPHHHPAPGNPAASCAAVEGVAGPSWTRGPAPDQALLPARMSTGAPPREARPGYAEVLGVLRLTPA